MSWWNLEPIDPIKRESSSINQCFKCMGRWPRNSYLTKKGYERRSCPHCGGRNVILGTRTNVTSIITRKDLAMLTSDRYPDEFCPSTTLEELEANRFPIATYGKAKMFVSRGFHPADQGHYIYLFEGSTLWMTTWKGERLAMLLSVMYECPGGRVFVAGLGVGLILLYLAVSRKTTEVVVAETSENIIGLVEPIIRPWLAREYPDFKWSIIQGDAFEEVKKNGKFDWIYFDIWKDMYLRKEDPTVEKAYEASKDHLTERGIFSNWIDAVRSYNILRHF